MPISEQLTLPSGYGSPNQLLDWTVVEQRLVDSLHYWLATVRRDGTPHVVPLDGIWLDGVQALREVFSSTTIADIARREAAETGAGIYHI